MGDYQHKEKPTLYAYRMGCHCVGCRKLNAQHQAKATARRNAAKASQKSVVLAAAPDVGHFEAKVRADLVGIVDSPWCEVWKDLAIFHAQTLDIIEVNGARHLAGTAHTKLAEAMEHLRPTSKQVQALDQGISDLEAFANEL